MVKYFLIALILHLAFFLNFDRYNVMGDPNSVVRINIPISYNIVNTEQRIDGMNLVKGGKQVTEQEVGPEPKIEPEKIEKISEPEIKSKMTNNKIQEPKKKEEKKPEKKKTPQKKVSENQDTKKSEKTSSSEDIFTKSGNFTANSDGTYTAISSKGINFEIVNQPAPDYPRQAEMIRYSQIVTVEVRFLVGLDGSIEDIKIIKSHEKFGFDNEVLKILKKWKFKPITYNGKKIKVYFNKEFVFTPKS